MPHNFCPVCNVPAAPSGACPSCLALDTFYADVFVTACEGGITYWADVVRYHWRKRGAPAGSTAQDVRGFYAYIVERETGTAYTIDYAAIARGVGRLTRVGGLADWATPRGLRDAFADRDAGNIDADGADVIVQAGLFGKVIYG